jgi:hypothetical protein
VEWRDGFGAGALHTAGMDLWGRAGRRGAAVAGLLGAGLALGGCASSFASVDEMEAVPGARTVYPGSVVYEKTSLPPERNLWADNPGMLLTAACTAASRAEVVAWLDHELTSSGWTAESAKQWRHGDTELVLSFLTDEGMRWYDGRHPELAGATEQAGCTLAYRVRLGMLAPSHR